MVQTELSLESVKVVRNDLSESDMEVVSAKEVETKTAPLPVVETAASAEGEGWKRPSSRWLGVGKL